MTTIMFPRQLDEQVTRIVGMIADCSDHLDDLESALDSVEQIVCQDAMAEYAERLAATKR